MGSKQKQRKAERGFILGDEAFARISAVEGLVATPEMDALFREFDREGLTPDERRRVLNRRYGRGA